VNQRVAPSLLGMLEERRREDALAGRGEGHVHRVVHAAGHHDLDLAAGRTPAQDVRRAGDERRLAGPLGGALARRWARVGTGAEVIVPVPVHAKRERRRGYDQAALIADVAGKRLGLPVARALERHRATVAQFELGRDERAANVDGAFQVRAGPGAGAARAISGRWILLVDDVVTTGATLAACAFALERAGALAVSAIAVARER
jgi:ComF family protein